jgi:ParB family chromosome partitioning protein
VATYLGRVTKARILEAVREAKGEQASQLIEDLKKMCDQDVANRLVRALSDLRKEPLAVRATSAGIGDQH